MYQGDSKGAPDALKLSISAGNGPFVQAVKSKVVRMLRKVA